jgi:hypothetical protein
VEGQAEVQVQAERFMEAVIMPIALQSAMNFILIEELITVVFPGRAAQVITDGVPALAVLAQSESAIMAFRLTITTHMSHMWRQIVSTALMAATFGLGSSVLSQ